MGYTDRVVESREERGEHYIRCYVDMGKSYSRVYSKSYSMVPELPHDILRNRDLCYSDIVVEDYELNGCYPRGSWYFPAEWRNLESSEDRDTAETPGELGSDLVLDEYWVDGATSH